MRRRDFLLTSTLAASQLVVPRVHSSQLATAEETGDQLRFALIGAGAQGRLLLNAAQQVPAMSFAAICDIWPYSQRYAQNFVERQGQKVTVYTDHREMLDKETSLDAVLIATPDFVHAPQAIDCLEKGLHVYCEPMLAHSLDAGRKVIDAVKRSGKLLQVGFHKRSNPRYRHMRDKLLLEAKLPGVVTAVQTQWAREAEEFRGWASRFVLSKELLQRYGYQDMKEFRNWMWFPQYGGGPFCCHVSHQLDACHWLLGAKPQAVIASGGSSFYDDRPHCDTVMSVLEYPRVEGGGPLRASSNMFTTTSAGGIRQYERLLGTQGSLQLSDNPAWTRIGREANADDWDQWVRREYLVKPEDDVPYGEEEDAVDVQMSGELEFYQLPPLQTRTRFAPHLANFCAAIQGHVKLTCPPEVAWASHVATFKTLEAVRTQQRVTLSEEDYRV